MPGGRALLRSLIVLLFVHASPGSGQTVHPDSSAGPALSIQADSAAHRADTIAAPRTKSPTLAMALSGVLPGAGQVYNESYWKAPLILGLGVYFISEWLDNNRRAEDYRQKYTASLQLFSSGDPRLLALREFYKNQRDSFTWYFFILYVLNIVDAYVDASLYSFDVSPALTMRGLPVHGLTIRFTW